MNSTAVKAMMAEIAPVIRDYVEASFAPIERRLAAIEARPAPERGEPGVRGTDGVGIADLNLSDGVLVIRLSDGTEKQVGPVTGPPGEKGEDGVAPDLETIAAAVSEGFRGMAESIIVELVAQGLAQIPAPEKGEKGDIGNPGKDGCGISDLVIDRDGALVVTMEDGRMKNLGPVIGNDGVPGKDGRDGFSLEDFDIVPNEDGRTIEMKFASNGTVHSYELQFPVVIDRGVFKAGETYQPGDGVTWGGSWWIAQVETGAKPDSADSGWRLAVKKGRDGKDGKNAP